MQRGCECVLAHVGGAAKNKYVGLQREKTGSRYKSSQSCKECVAVTRQFFTNSLRFNLKSVSSGAQHGL